MNESNKAIVNNFLKNTNEEDKFEIMIPFDGFYESIISLFIENQIERDLEEEESEFFNWELESVDHKAIAKLIAENYGAFLKETIEENLKGTLTHFDFKFKELISPRFYNFETDRIICEVSRKTLGLILFYAANNTEQSQNRLNDLFTESSGFIPFSEYVDFKDNWLEWNKEIDCNMVYALLPEIEDYYEFYSNIQLPNYIYEEIANHINYKESE